MANRTKEYAFWRFYIFLDFNIIFACVCIDVCAGRAVAVGMIQLVASVYLGYADGSHELCGM